MTRSGRRYRSPSPADGPSPDTGALRAFLAPHEESAARSLIWRVLDRVPARLVEAALFGSRARGTARPDSDIDILLVFARLPPGREPHAGIAEQLAAGVARQTGVPLTVWSVSVEDTRRGHRTPMLVDAFADAIPLWCWPGSLAPLSFTPADALYCCRSLQARVAEGSREFEDLLRRGMLYGAAARARDDIVRLCTATLLLRGITRPRRAQAVRLAACELAATGHYTPTLGYALKWAADSFGPSGADEELAVAFPACGFTLVAEVVDHLRYCVTSDADRLAARPAGLGFDLSPTGHCSCTR